MLYVQRMARLLFLFYLILFTPKVQNFWWQLNNIVEILWVSFDGKLHKVSVTFEVGSKPSNAQTIVTNNICLWGASCVLNPSKASGLKTGE